MTKEKLVVFWDSNLADGVVFTTISQSQGLGLCHVKHAMGTEILISQDSGYSLKITEQKMPLVLLVLLRYKQVFSFLLMLLMNTISYTSVQVKII